MKAWQGSVTVFVMIIVGLTVGMYLMGYESIMVNIMRDKEGTLDVGSVDINTLRDRFIDAMTSPMGISALGLGALFAVLAGIGLGGMQYIAGTILGYAIPIFLLFLIANIFAFPILTESSVQEGLPDIGAVSLSLLLTLVFNVLLMLAILSFATGRD